MNLSDLKRELTEISDLRSVANVLEWDQLTYLPKGGEHARGRQLGLVSRILHERCASPTLSKLVDNASRMADEDSVDGAIVRRARRMVERAQRVPAELQSELTAHASRMYGEWVVAKKDNDFERIRPLLEKNVELSRRYADHFDFAHPADAFIDENDPGMSAESIRTLFASLRKELVPIVHVLRDADQPDSSFLERDFPHDAQLKFADYIARAVGYDFERGRQDLTAHPFMIRFSGGDVRITTRVGSDPTGAIFGTIHESGHALYEQGIDAALDGTPLGAGTSTGVHESQSRLWENIVGRSLSFWTRHYPALVEHFPEALGDVSLANFHRTINRVHRSLKRVESDEVSYNLHVMLRFDLELEVLEGKLAIADLPEAWNARMLSDLGIEVPSDADGCLQDVHWYCMPFGGSFQGYTLGNLMSAQFYEAACKGGGVSEALETGETAPLRKWLTENVYTHGGRYMPDELVQRVTGRPLSADSFLSYLRQKYGALYAVDL
ncbi:MAG: carboxypeptidase Taq [Polyangiales bacterium]|jgi:carboxypeptidase Taq